MIVLPDHLKTLDPTRLAEMEQERVALIASLQQKLATMPPQTIDVAVRNVQNALASAMPGSVTVLDACALMLVVGANMTGAFLDQITSDDAMPKQLGRVEACIVAFGEILRQRQRITEAQKHMAKMRAAGNVVQMNGKLP